MNEEEAWRDYEKYLLTAAVNSDYFLNKVLSGKLNLLEVRQQAYLFYNEFIAFIVDNDRVFIDSLTAEEKALILAHRMGKTV
jgi:hypothetical protein